MDFDFDDEPSVQASPAARAGARFKPKARPIPKKKQVSSSTSQTTNLSTQSENPVSLEKTLPEKNVNVISEGVKSIKEQSVLRACTAKQSDHVTEAPAVTNDPETQDSSTFEDTHHAQREEETEECHLDMETLDIVQEEGTTTTNAYEKHSGKFQPKPRVMMLETVIEEEPEFTVNDESRTDDFNTNTQEEEERNVPEEPKLGKSKRPASRKRKTPIVKDPIDDSNENTEKEKEKKKFKHSSRRQKRTLEKELLETPDHEIKDLSIRDMLRLVEYKEWLKKKEGKGAVPVVQPTQESNVNAASGYNNNQYNYSQGYSQGFGGEEYYDEFAMEETENQETELVKPDSPVNYQTYMKKSSRVRWSKQDTELFYEGIREFGSNLSMVQHLFPDRTCKQIKLKFKLEERKFPLKLNDALANRSKQLFHYHNVIKKLQQEAAAEREGEEEDGEEQEEEARGEGETETTTDVPENEEPTKTEETESGGVKESDGGDVEKNGVRSDGGDEGDDDDFWNSYKSEL